MMATNLRTGCLMTTHSPNETCNGSGKLNDCGMYLASGTLSNGVRIHFANNHPWLFGGPQRLAAALDHMRIDPQKLGTILVGHWNSQSWAKETHADPNREKKGLYPISQLTEPSRRCGGGFDVSNATLVSALTVPWEVDDVMEYFAIRGF